MTLLGAYLTLRRRTRGGNRVTKVSGLGRHLLWLVVRILIACVGQVTMFSTDLTLMKSKTRVNSVPLFTTARTFSGCQSIFCILAFSIIPRIPALVVSFSIVTSRSPLATIALS